MSDIFISYKREDRARAESFAHAFEQEGWSVFWDRDILPGKAFDLFLSEELAVARCIVVLWSVRSVGSDWVKEEAQRGASRNILVPVLIDEVSPPLGFGRIEAAELHYWDGDTSDREYQNLIRAIRALVEQHSRPEPSTTPVPAPTAEALPPNLASTKKSPPAGPRHARRIKTQGIVAGLLILVVVAIVIVVLVLRPRADRVFASLGLLEPEGVPSQDEGTFPTTYAYQRTDGGLRVSHSNPYLSDLLQSGVIHTDPYIPVTYPKLSVKVLNRTDQPVLLSEAVIHVESSEVDTEPVPWIQSDFDSYDTFHIVNDGWGALEDAASDLEILAAASCPVGPVPATGLPHHLRLGRILELRTVEVTPFVPARMRNREYACVRGRLGYTTERKQARQSQFKTLVKLSGPFVAPPLPPNTVYGVVLPAGKSGYTKNLSIGQEIAAGRSDHFLLQLMTDKSASFTLRLTIKGIDETEVLSERVELSIFVPRTKVPELVDQRELLPSNK